MHVLFTYAVGKWNVWVWVDDIICGESGNSTMIPFIFRSILLWKYCVYSLMISEKIIIPLISETNWHWNYFPHTFLISGFPPISTKWVQWQISFSDISWVSGLKPKYFGCNRNFPFSTKKQKTSVLVLISKTNKTRLQFALRPNTELKFGHTKFVSY